MQGRRIGFWSMAVAAMGVACSAARADVELIGRAVIPAHTSDLSGLSNTIGSGIPHDRFGGWGSAIAWTGERNRYVVAADRGPGDGSTAFHCRVHYIEIDPPSGDPREVKVSIAQTVLVTTSEGQPYWGNTGNYKVGDQSAGVRLDPEGIRCSPTGTLWLSDEYGPWIDEFSAEGRHIRRIAPPAKFLIANPGGDPDQELPPHNTSGRQPNRGFEGLAISTDGSRLYAIPQSPLIQDGALDPENERTGRNIRLLELNPATGATRELVYPLNSASFGVSEVLAFGEAGLLVVERDGKAGDKAKFRAIFAVDLQGATDVSGVDSLPATELPATIQPARKRKLLDFLDPRFRLAGPDMPEKIEGLCFGPDLPDGRRMLVVTTDNDFKDEAPSHVWLFAIDASDLGTFMPRAIAPH